MFKWILYLFAYTVEGKADCDIEVYLNIWYMNPL